jgi:hypothetical protein
LFCVCGTVTDGDLERFEGGVTGRANEGRIVLIGWLEAPTAEDTETLAPTDDATAALECVRESEAARARSLDGT